MKNTIGIVKTRSNIATVYWIRLQELWMQLETAMPRYAQMLWKDVSFLVIEWNDNSAADKQIFCVNILEVTTVLKKRNSY